MNGRKMDLIIFDEVKELTQEDIKNIKFYTKVLK